ncbi:MAG: stage II sporulation protein R [Clostridia bacterium]|nr:stage II sporulation protein R [Clostridia bacterium]
MKKVICSIAIGFLVAIFAAIYSSDVQANLSNNLVRLHIIANSDSETDQEIKLKVRDRIIYEMSDCFSSGQSTQECKTIIQSNIDRITEIANDELKKNNLPYTATAVYGNFEFPTKVYENITLPPGKYEAVRVILGNGYGKNWWCVMFPPLCFVDETKGSMDAESNEMLEQNLNDQSYEIITNADPSHLDVEVKFKIVEIMQKAKQDLENIVS